MNCPFCHLAASARALAQDAHASVIFSNPRLMPGHLLVIPHRHVQALWELEETEMISLWRHIAAFEQKLIAAGLGTGCDIRQNYRPFLPDGKLKQSHLHVHIQPRSFEDQLYASCPVPKPRSFKS